jgi:hypothetical protein
VLPAPAVGEWAPQRDSTGDRFFIQKWFGEPAGIGPNRGAFSSAPRGRQSRSLQAKAAHNAKSGPACHAEGRGFESHQPLGKPCKWALFSNPRRSPYYARDLGFDWCSAIGAKRLQTAKFRRRQAGASPAPIGFLEPGDDWGTDSRPATTDAAIAGRRTDPPSLRDRAAAPTLTPRKPSPVTPLAIGMDARGHRGEESDHPSSRYCGRSLTEHHRDPPENRPLTGKSPAFRGAVAAGSVGATLATAARSSHEDRRRCSRSPARPSETRRDRRSRVCSRGIPSVGREMLTAK